VLRKYPFTFWSLDICQSGANVSRYQSDSKRLRHLTESRITSSSSYDVKIKRAPGQNVHTHAGQNTQTSSDFMCPGGTLTIRSCSAAASAHASDLGS